MEDFSVISDDGCQEKCQPPSSLHSSFLWSINVIFSQKWHGKCK